MEREKKIGIGVLLIYSNHFVWQNDDSEVHRNTSLKKEMWKSKVDFKQ